MRSTCQTKSLVLNSYSGTFLNQKKKKFTISIGIDLRTCFQFTWTIHRFEIINHSFLPEEEIRGSLLSINNVVSSFYLPHVRLAETSQPQIPEVYWELVCYMLLMKWIQLFVFIKTAMIFFIKRKTLPEILCCLMTTLSWKPALRASSQFFI